MSWGKVGAMLGRQVQRHRATWLAWAGGITLALTACGDDAGSADAAGGSTGVNQDDSTSGDTNADSSDGPASTGSDSTGSTSNSGTDSGSETDGTSGNPTGDSTGTGSGACVDLGSAQGEVDTGALAAGIVVTLTDGDTRGELTIPFLQPLPNASPLDISMEMLGSVSALVSADESGSSADLGAGTLVMAMLANPGEYSWAVDDTGCEVTMRFVNQTPGGLTLTPGTSYTATFSVAPNDYVEAISATSMPVTVVSR